MPLKRNKTGRKRNADITDGRAFLKPVRIPAMPPHGKLAIGDSLVLEMLCDIIPGRGEW
jgi:hypothetical protein